MYRLKLICDGAPAELGAQAACNITEEFTHRPWHTYAQCTWEDQVLVLSVENDFDDNGLATSDEFSDAISACIEPGFDGDIQIVEAIEIHPQ